METEGEFVFATSLDTKDTDQIAEFLEQSVRGEATARSLPRLLRGPPWPRHPACHPVPTMRHNSPGPRFCLLQTPARG